MAVYQERVVLRDAGKFLRGNTFIERVCGPGRSFTLRDVVSTLWHIYNWSVSLPHGRHDALDRISGKTSVSIEFGAANE